MATSAATGPWRRTEFAAVSAVFLYFAGTSFVIPFLPLYVIELDGFDLATAALWSGLVLGATPLMSGIVAPFWGRLSDRIGQKLLLQRSLLGFTLCLGLMAIAGSSLHLLIIRACMGLVGGFAVTSQAMVSIGAPREAVTRAIGRTNAARVLGMAIGPLPGGLLADTVGIRGACVGSVVAGAAAFGIVTVFVRAPRPVAAFAGHPKPGGFLTAGFVAHLAVVTTVRMAEKSFDPVIPLLIVGIEDKPFGPATVTAIVSSAGLLAAALGSGLAGRVGGRDAIAQRRTVSVLLLVTAPVMVGVFFAGVWWLILALRAVAGFALGIVGSVATARVALTTPVQRIGSAMGLVGSGSALGSATGQFGAGLLAVILLPAVFLVNAGVLVVSSLASWLWGGKAAVEATATTPRAEDMALRRLHG